MDSMQTSPNNFGLFFPPSLKMYANTELRKYKTEKWTSTKAATTDAQKSNK